MGTALTILNNRSLFCRWFAFASTNPFTFAQINPRTSAEWIIRYYVALAYLNIFYFVEHTTFAVSYIFRSITQRKWSYSNFGTVQRWTLCLFGKQLARRWHWCWEHFFSSVWLLPICSLFILHNHHILFIGSHYCSRLKLIKCTFSRVLTKFVRPDFIVAAGVFYTFELQPRLVIREGGMLASVSEAKDIRKDSSWRSQLKFLQGLDRIPGPDFIVAAGVWL